MKLRTVGVLLCVFLFAATAFGQANGKLQIHFIDVGQGDGALLIQPRCAEPRPQRAPQLDIPPLPVHYLETEYKILDPKGIEQGRKL